MTRIVPEFLEIRIDNRVFVVLFMENHNIVIYEYFII